MNFFIKYLSICAFMVSMAAFSQAKKPTLMVFPSDRFCISNGYAKTYTEMGIQKQIPDYKKALQSDEKLRLAISQMGAIMAKRDFPLKDLETELKRLETEEAEVSLVSGKSGGTIQENPVEALKRVAKADIILDLDFSIKEAGLGQNYATFNLKGVDAYTSKIIASASGSGKPFMTNQVEVLLEMAVKDHMDNFANMLSAHFEDMFSKGREVTVQIKTFGSSKVALDDEFSYSDYNMEGEELSYIIEEFFKRNTVSGRFSLSDVTENSMRLDQVRIAMLDESGRANDTRSFITKLRKFLSKSPFNIESKIYLKGLGEAWLILGEK